MRVLTAEQMRAVESNAVSLGLGWLRLMENAGSAAAKEIRNILELDGRRVVILCGKGNNGGDGYVIARKLQENDISTYTIAVGTPSTDSTKEMYSKAITAGIKPLMFESYEQLCLKHISEADVIIDALFGTGFKGQPEGIYSTVIKAVNATNSTVVSIDVPSGIESDGGALQGEFIKADLTISFAAYKPCHLLYPTNEYCGKVTVTAIGIPEPAYNGISPYANTVSAEECRKLLPQRGLNHHKGLSGTAGLYVGSKHYPGAAVISTKAAIKSGAGIVNAIIDDSIYPIVGTSAPEAIYTILRGDTSSLPNPEDASIITDTINHCTAALVGCGISKRRYAAHNVIEVLNNCAVPLVLDADGINHAVLSIDMLREYRAEKILTPHPKEASRLLGCSVNDIQANRDKSALIIAKLCKAVTILKGANTVIATPEGELFFLTDGNPGMATAGTGDMLAGMAVSFLAQGLSAKDSAILAAYLHALSGDRALKTSSLLSLTPTDMLEALPAVIDNLYNPR